MDLGLDNQQSLICHKTQTTNQPTTSNSLRITILNHQMQPFAALSKDLL